MIKCWWDETLIPAGEIECPRCGSINDGEAKKAGGPELSQKSGNPRSPNKNPIRRREEYRRNPDAKKAASLRYYHRTKPGARYYTKSGTNRDSSG